MIALRGMRGRRRERPEVPGSSAASGARAVGETGRSEPVQRARETEEAHAEGIDLSDDLPEGPSKSAVVIEVRGTDNKTVTPEGECSLCGGDHEDAEHESMMEE